MRVFTTVSLVLFALLWLGACQPQTDIQEARFVCKPCMLPCDTIGFNSPGTCPHCQMKLVARRTVIPEQQTVTEPVQLHEGSGAFLFAGGKAKADVVIRVYYHKPASFTDTSAILLVLPGAGRNGDSYRDAWVAAAEQYGVLILSPAYPESVYPFEAYHLGGLITKLNIEEVVRPVPQTNQVELDEEGLRFETVPDPESWLFADFDRMFELARKACRSKRTRYDLFGHSAGGQILHRLALVQPQSKADRIVASNSGFYTLPTDEYPYPFGLQSTPIEEANLQDAFARKLVLLIGELDNATEQGGTLLRSQSADVQGLHRLERSRYFYQTAQRKATQLGVELQWEHHVVPGVGHEQAKMASAAAEYLYLP